jgi:hypothetical protein
MVGDSSHHPKENAMECFLKQYSHLITGVISCFDRLIFKGHLSISWADGMERFMASQQLKIMDFKRFVENNSRRIQQHAEATAKRLGRPYVYLERRSRKEDEARKIAERDGIREGLICVLRVVESCQSYRMIPGDKRPRLVSAVRKCLFFYFYYMDREFGLMHVRIQAWFPLTVQIAVNGHEWLARKLDRNGIAYRKQDNAFLEISDPQRAQKFADRFVGINWPRVLTALAKKVNPLLGDLLADDKYYWVADQAEYATDVMFRDKNALQPVYEQLLRHATLCFSAEDVLKFLGRKPHAGFQGEVLTDAKRKREPGARVKHRVGENWIKMYDKFGSVLRIETVINQPKQFQVRRPGKRRGKEIVGWFPMAKGVANLYRYAEVSLAANRRYLEALAAAPAPVPERHAWSRLSGMVRRNGRTYRGFNPAATDDMRLFKAVLRGEHLLRGFRNREVAKELFAEPRDAVRRRRISARVSRLLKRLRMHGCIAKIPRSRRWRVTADGQVLLANAIHRYDPNHVQTPITQAA